MTGAICASGLYVDCDIGLSMMPYVRPYLEKRLLEHRTTGLMLLNSLHKIAQQLSTENGDPAKFQEYALGLLHLATETGRQQVRELLLPGPGDWDPEGFNYDLLTAAAYTNHAILVKKLEGSPPGLMGGIFGDPYGAALVGRQFDILSAFFENVSVVDTTKTYWLLQKAAENDDKEMVEFILRADWSPCKSRSAGDRAAAQIERALRTPSIEIFDIVMQERRKLDQEPLSLNTLSMLLRGAIIRNWGCMAGYIMSLGVTSETLGWPIFGYSQPLHLACEAGHDDAVKFLLSHQVHVSCTEMEAATGHGHASTLKLLLEHGDLDVKHAENCLAVAAGKGHLGIVRMLLDAGMDPNKGSTIPMVQAVRAEHPGICQLLIERGATMTVAQAVAEAARMD